MKIRWKILLPIVGVFFLSFSIFIVFLSFNQGSKKRIELENFAKNLTALVATANSAYLWNYDLDGLGRSMSAFQKMKEVVSIEIFDALGNSIAKLEKEDVKGNTFTEEGQIYHEEDLIGTVKIVFTDLSVYEDIKNLRSMLILLGASLFIFMSVMILLFLHPIITPIKSLVVKLKDIAEGEGDLTKELAVRSNDELGEMAQYFNRSLMKIKKMVLSLRDQTEVLNSVGQDLATNMTQTAAAVNQINANVQSFNNQVINQTSSVTETIATMNNITESLKKLKNYIDKQSQSVDETSSTIQQMVANIESVTQTLIHNASNVEGLTRASEKGGDDLALVSQLVRNVSEESKGLIEVSNVIQSIASQTNLLAMNAAIEAAHAGEAGRGFAVVADEIRKLSESSGEQAKTVTSVLKGIMDLVEQNDINKRVKTVSDMELVIRDAMDTQGESSKKIISVMEELKAITDNVKDSSNEMLLGSQEVLNESVNLGHISDELSGSIKEIAGAISEILASINAVNDISQRNNEIIQNLNYEIAKFKVE